MIRLPHPTLSHACYAVLALACALVCTQAVAAGAIEGRATVIDGDTIEIQGKRIRFHGLDAPESRQMCQNGKGESYRCGKAAAFFLDDLLKGRVVSCDQRATDRYGRIIGACTAINANGDLFDINATMVRAGHALAYRRYSKDYVRHEKLASREKRGMWAGSFHAPWDWRKIN